MPAENPQRRKISAREAAEKYGVSTRTIRRVTAEPRTEFLARAKSRREQVARLRIEGNTYSQIAAAMGISVGTTSTLVTQARKYGLLPAVLDDKVSRPARAGRTGVARPSESSAPGATSKTDH
jgi:transposase